MHKVIRQMRFRRRREAKTDYRKRIACVKGGLDRVVARKTNTRIIGQISRYAEKGDITLAYADSAELAGLGWPARANRSTAYLVGRLLARKARARPDLKAELVLDIGLSSPVRNSIPFALAKGCIDGGLRIRNSIEIDAKVYNCADAKHIAALKDKEPERYRRQYSGYIKAGIAPESLSALFTKVNEMIEHGQ